MWPYKNHLKTEYYRVVEFVQNYAESLGARVCVHEIGENHDSFEWQGHWRDFGIKPYDLSEDELKAEERYS